MKKSKLKSLLSVFFILVIIISLAVIIINYTMKEDSELYETPPSEIVVDDSDKFDVEVEDDNSIAIAPDVDLDQERLNHNNNDIIGRLEIPDLFNVLVVKSNNNTYYLNHSIDKKSDIRGSEFLDYRLNPTSKQINIYGHNTRDKNIKVPFLKLEEFLDKTFFDEHPYIIFQHNTGKNIYKIISIKEITTDYEHMNFNQTGENFINHINHLVSNSIFVRDVEYDEESEIIVLQTCSHHLDNAYYIITGIKIEHDF